MNDTLAMILSNKLRHVCQSTQENGEEMKTLGEILLGIKKPESSTEIPMRMIALGDYIITEMELLANLLKNEVAAIKEKN